MPHRSSEVPFTLRRREWLSAAVAVTTLAAFPWEAGLSADPPVGQADFLRLSQRLTGRAPLDAAMGQRIFAALVANNPQFPEQIQDLLHLIERRNVADDAIVAALASENPELAPLAGQIMTAWYLGVVGSGALERVVAFEHALNAQAVADQLRPPTYSYGVPGSWSLAPQRSS